MHWKTVKKLRVILSLIFFIATFLVFIDLKNFFSPFSGPVLFLQFLPSLLKFIVLLSFSTIGFMIIILITSLFGRAYCSSVCPLGTLQDITTHFARKLKKIKDRKKFFSYSKPQRLWRYSILGASIVTFLTGFNLLLNLFDPYSNFGRFTTNFAKPIIIFLNNGLVKILEGFNIYSLFPVEYRPIAWFQFIFPVLMFGLVIWFSYRYGRLYCNTVCPVGTLLGLISKKSFFRLTIDHSACNHCGQCMYDCKSGCINKEGQKIDFSRCVMCFNCFQSCSKDAIHFENPFTRKNTVLLEKALEPVDLKKRKFLAGSLIFLSSMSGSRILKDTLTQKKPIVVNLPSTVPVIREFPVVPPGAISLAHFTKYCTACTLCVSACPNHVLQPSFLQYGLEGMMQPFMDYNSGFCNYDCKICAEVCPTSAIEPIKALEDKHTIQMGKSRFIKENCVVYTEGTDCGACSEHCPTKAVNMVPFEDTDLFIPEVNEDICVGCGACEYPCPTRPYKAIYVEGNPEHLVAEKPAVEQMEDIDLGEKEFPF
jgi:ferredoxin